MLNLINSFKAHFPGSHDMAVENLLRATIAMYANKTANSALKRETGKYDPTIVRINRAYIMGLVCAYQECGWLISVSFESGKFQINDPDECVNIIENIVEDWIRGDM